MYQIVSALLLGVAVVACIVNFVLATLHRRAIRRLAVLDRLLTNICVDAFMSQHRPIWQAWAQVMGALDVQVTTRRKGTEP